MDCRATSTKSVGSRNSCWCSRKLSRNNRRARLRTWAGPTRRLVITPRRERAPDGKVRQFATRQPLARRRPLSRMTPNSRECRMRMDRDSFREDEDPPMSRQLDGSQSFPAGAPTIPQNAPAALARIPAQETVLSFPPDLRRLIGSLHINPLGSIACAWARFAPIRAATAIIQSGRAYQRRGGCQGALRPSTESVESVQEVRCGDSARRRIVRGAWR
jgi:hypothetical protein